MLITDQRRIGNRILAIRKSRGKTQMEVAEAASLADRTYSDIERGTSNMRVETLLRICEALNVTPDEILTEEVSEYDAQDESMLLNQLHSRSVQEQRTAIKLLDVYLQSLS